MAILVHLTSEKNVKRIARNGIKKTQVNLPEVCFGVFCMPVTDSYYISHQWLRELKRRGQRTFVGIYFRLGPQEPVWVGHYAKRHLLTTVGKAIRFIKEAPDAQGFQLIVPRSIAKNEIHRVRRLSQVLGWRYMPGAHAFGINCTCRVCVPRGAIKSKRIRSRAAAREEKD